MAVAGDSERRLEAGSGRLAGDAKVHAGRVRLAAGFEDPNPVAFTVRSSLGPGEALDRLQVAFGDYFETDARDPRYLRLDGSVAGDLLTLIVRPYIRPGKLQVRGMRPVTVRGEVVSTARGSELRATARTAPVGRAAAVLAVALAGWILLGISGGLLTGMFALVGGAVLAAGWTWLIRFNQRSALRKVDVVAGILESILNPPEGLGT